METRIISSETDHSDPEFRLQVLEEAQVARQKGHLIKHVLERHAVSHSIFTNWDKQLRRTGYLVPDPEKHPNIFKLVHRTSSLREETAKMTSDLPAHQNVATDRAAHARQILNDGIKKGWYRKAKVVNILGRATTKLVKTKLHPKYEKPKKKAKPEKRQKTDNLDATSIATTITNLAEDNRKLRKALMQIKEILNVLKL